MKRGRKSPEASLSKVVSLVPGTRPNPPPELTEAQALTWRTIVARRPASWFLPEVHPLLTQLCRHIDIARMIGAALAEIDPKSINDDAGFRRFTKLRSMHDREGAAVVRLATKLRITLSAQYDARSAHAAARPRTGPKPWETGNDDAG